VHRVSQEGDLGKGCYNNKDEEDGGNKGMKDTLELALAFTLKWEGGYVNHPNDPGGPTNMGITLGSAKAYHLDINKDGIIDEEDIKALSLEDVVKVYKERYWDVVKCDYYNWDFAIALFDTAVNCGNGRANIWAGRWENDVDGLLTRRILHYDSLISKDSQRFGVFKKGWMNRVNDLKKYLDIIREEKKDS